MIPPRRMETLLSQAQTHQLNQCLYHNIPSKFELPSQSQTQHSARSIASPWSASTSRHTALQPDPSHSPSTHNFHSHSQTNVVPSTPAMSLYSDHYCEASMFPRLTTTILEVHTDEVWNVEWSHDGRLLASGGKDKLAIIWVVGVSVHFCV